MLIQTKKTAYLPLGSIRRLPIAFQPTFYSKVVDLVKGVNEPMLTDSSVILADKVAELNHIVESPKSDDSKLVDEAVTRVQQFWSSTRHLLKGYSNSINTQEATMARKALDILERLPNKVLRTNASEMLTTLIDNFDAAWKPADLTGTFLETWRPQLATVANDYARVYQNRVDNGAAHNCFTEKKSDVFQTFEFFYMNLYVCVGLTGDLSLMELQSKINELIMIYTSISKSRATRIANQKQMVEDSNSGDSSTTTADETAETVEATKTADEEAA